MNAIRRGLTKLRRDGLLATLGTVAAMVRWRLNFRARAAYRSMLRLDGLEDRFSAIYAHNLWSSAESGSGEGSEVGYTQNLREWLVRIIPRYGIKRLVDAPCGDFNWMRLVVPQVDLDYCGIDIVESVIESNRDRYGGPAVRFEAGNICTDPLPACDLLMVRDCLFHLSYADISRFLENLARTDYRYLLTTTHITRDGFRNGDIQSGDFRQIDLFEPPFGFPRGAVIDEVDDYPPGYPVPRKMILIAKPDVPTKLTFP